MAYNPQNPNGQTTSANSAPVVIASDQSTLPVSLSGGGTLAINQTQVNGNSVVTAASGVQAMAVSDGTNTANVVAGDTGYNGLATTSGTKTISFTTSSSGAQTIGPYNCEGYSWVEVVYTSIGTGLAITGGQFSPIVGGTYVTSLSFNVALGGNLGTLNNNVYGSPIHGNYFQIAVSALTSGTFSGYITFRSNLATINQLLAQQAGTWNLGSSSNSALADSTANPTTNLLGAMNEIYNGSTWDRVRSAASANNTTGTGVMAAGDLGIVRTSEPSAFTATQYAAISLDKVGKQISLPYANPENFIAGNASVTSTTSTQVIAAQAAGIKIYVTGVSLSNSGASNTIVLIQNGSGGTTMWQGIAPAGGGSNIVLPTPLATSAATALYFASGTATSTLYVSVTGYIGA